jgi:hypothetical protein
MKEKNRPKHKGKIYLLLTISLALAGTNYSCSGTKRTNNKTEMNQTTTTLTANFDVSTKTRQFIKNIQDELDSQKILISKYIPSKNIIEEYDIIQIENLYHISGMIMTNEAFESSSLNEIGVKIGNQSGKFTTIQIPINSFDLFLKNQGIAYFQISEKTKTK